MITRFSQQSTFLDQLYEYMLPKNHEIRKLYKAMDFSFVNDLCADAYADSGTGRPPESPERIFRMFFLQFYRGMSSETKLVERVTTDVAFRFFCKFHIDEKIPDHSTLYAFRKRIGPEGFQKIFERILLQCIEQGLVDGERLMFDCTHTVAKGTPFSKYQQAFILSKALVEYLEDSHLSKIENSDNMYSPEFLKLISQVASETTGYKRPETIERKLLESLVSDGKVATSKEPVKSENSDYHEVSDNSGTPVDSNDLGSSLTSGGFNDAANSDNPDDPGGGLPMSGENRENSDKTGDSVDSDNYDAIWQEKISKVVKKAQKATNDSDERVSEGLASRKELEKIADEIRSALPHTKGDPDARTGHTSSKKIFTGYLNGVMTDDKHQVIVSVKSYSGNVRQANTVIDAMKYYRQKVAPLLSTDKSPEAQLSESKSTEAQLLQLALDSAFDYMDVYETASSCGFCTITSLRKRASQKKRFDHDCFKMNEKKQLQCPAGNLMRRSEKPDKQKRFSYYGGKACKDCPLRKLCTDSAKGRTVQVVPEEKLIRQKLLKESKTNEHRSALRQRMVIEGVFGNGKTYHNLGKALYRNGRMQNLQSLMWAIFHNSMKLYRHGNKSAHISSRGQNYATSSKKTSNVLELDLTYAA